MVRNGAGKSNSSSIQKTTIFLLFRSGLKEPEYKVKVYYTRGPDYGNVKIFVNNRLTGEIKGYSPMIYPGGSSL